MNTFGDIISFFDGEQNTTHFRKRLGPEEKRTQDKKFPTNYQRCFNFMVKQSTEWIHKMMSVILPSNPTELFHAIISKVNASS